MANQLCAGGCGRVVSNTRRCVECDRAYNHDRNSRRTQYQGDWPARARAEIAEHRAAYGDICPGWDRPAHVLDPRDWTCDHDIGPLCRSCNGRKGATYDRADGATDG